MNQARQNQQASALKPHDLACEQGVLGVAMSHGTDVLAGLVDTLRVDDFYAPAHQAIWEAVLALFEAGQPVDEITVGSRLQEAGNMDRAGGHGFLAELCDIALTAEHAEHYASVVRDKGHARRFMEACRDAYKFVAGSHGDIPEAINEAAAMVYASESQAHVKGGLEPIKASILGTLQDLEKRKTAGIPTGISSLDKATSGLEPGDLIILAARPSVGKTAMATQIARSAAGIGHNVAFFSLEMSTGQLQMRLLSLEAKIDLRVLRERSYPKSDLPRLVDAADVLFGLPLFIDDSAALTHTQIRSRARKMASKHGLGLVIVDYLQLVRSNGGESREQQVSEVSRSLKAMAKDLGVPVIALSQLNRKIEDRGKDSRPQLSDLRESGAIEQDADGVWFLHRPDIKQATAELIIGKQRNGPCLDLQLYFNGPIAKFEMRSSYDQP